MRLGRAILISIILFVYPSVEYAEKNDHHIEALIVEVEGDPEEHKKFFNAYYPYLEVVAVYDTLFTGLAIKGPAKKFAQIRELDFIKGVYPVQNYQATAYPFSNPKNLKRESDYLQNNTSSQTSLHQPYTVMPEELNTTRFTGRDVRVAVIDTGIDYTHPDLVANYKGGYDVVDLDDDPMETTPKEGIPTSHGTHVAGIIAANGELKGVAPDANLYAYRALGSGGMGTSIQVIAALEEAVKAHADIINLSLGNSVNGPDYPTSRAVDEAVKRGAIVVIANGNEGPKQWTVGSPATAFNAISVGALKHSEKVPYLYDPVQRKRIDIPLMGGSVAWELEKDYQLVDSTDKKTWRGSIVLLERDKQSFYVLAKEAEEKGAVAVIFYNNEKGSFRGMLESEEGDLTIPVASMSKEGGLWLQKHIVANSRYVKTEYEQTEPTIAPFSSRGPVTLNWAIKPDIIAPGTNILSTVPGGYQALNGTSMAAPHVTGVIALLKEAYPNWSNEKIIGAVKTSALRLSSQKGKPLAPIIQGMGAIQPEAALNAETIIYQPLLAFGKITGSNETKEVSITIENNSNIEQTYYFDIPNKASGIIWHLPQTFTLDAHEKKTIPIKLQVMSGFLQEGTHQGWLTLKRDDETFYLPYLFLNKTTNQPITAGFQFSVKLFSKDLYTYQFYVTEPVKTIDVQLYNPDTLLFEQTLLQLKNVEVGVNKGEIKKSQVPKQGLYYGVITIQLENGEFVNEETMIYLN